MNDQLSNTKGYEMNAYPDWYDLTKRFYVALKEATVNPSTINTLLQECEVAFEHTRQESERRRRMVSWDEFYAEVRSEDESG